MIGLNILLFVASLAVAERPDSIHSGSSSFSGVHQGLSFGSGHGESFIPSRGFRHRTSLFEGRSKIPTATSFVAQSFGFLGGRDLGSPKVTHSGGSFSGIRGHSLDKLRGRQSSGRFNGESIRRSEYGLHGDSIRHTELGLHGDSIRRSELGLHADSIRRNKLGLDDDSIRRSKLALHGDSIRRSEFGLHDDMVPVSGNAGQFFDGFTDQQFANDRQSPREFRGQFFEADEMSGGRMFGGLNSPLAGDISDSFGTPKSGSLGGRMFGGLNRPLAGDISDSFGTLKSGSLGAIGGQNFRTFNARGGQQSFDDFNGHSQGTGIIDSRQLVRGFNDQIFGNDGVDGARQSFVDHDSDSFRSISLHDDQSINGPRRNSFRTVSDDVEMIDDFRERASEGGKIRYVPLVNFVVQPLGSQSIHSDSLRSPSFNSKTQEFGNEEAGFGGSAFGNSNLNGRTAQFRGSAFQKH